MSEKLPKPAGGGHEISAREAWRIFGIMAEFVEATERLAGIRPAVSVFGSSRAARKSPYFGLAETTSRLLSDAGFAVISGGGPGVMEAANKGAFLGRSPSIGLNIDLPQEQPSMMHSPFWRGMIDWLRERLAGEGMIDPGDVDLLQVIDEPQRVVDAIFSFYEKRGFQPSPAEHEVPLSL